MPRLAPFPAIALLLCLGATAHAAQAPGAAVPWMTYEAEDMTISGGMVVGPPVAVADKNTAPANTIERESSGQRCVELTAAGSYVQFIARRSANALVIRYSIPDSTDGAGLDSRLSVSVNGVQAAGSPLAITSRYSWRYGSFPFSNHPTDANPSAPATGPRGFYDEVRLKGLAIAPNDVVRIQKTAVDAASHLIIDLVDLETAPAAIAQPANALSVRAPPYNAAGDGITDDTAAIQRCLADGMSQGRAVYLPAGTYLVSREFGALDHVTIQGAGMWQTTLVGDPAVYNADPSRQIRFTGAAGANGIVIADLAIVGRLDHRNDGDANDGIEGEFGTGSALRNLWIEHTKTAVWVRNSSGLVVDSCRFRDTIADGATFTIGMAGSTMSNCTARGCGDDCFAIWPERASDIGGSKRFPPGLDVIRNCTGSVNALANGGAIYGGNGNAIQDCVFQDIPYGAGIMISGKFAVSDGFSGTTAIQRCSLVRTGGFDTAEWHAGLTIDPEAPAGDGLALAIDAVTVSDSFASGVMIMGGAPVAGTMNNVSIARFGLISPPSSLARSHDGSFGAWARGDARGSLAITGLTVNGTAVTAMPAQPSDLLIDRAPGTPPRFVFAFADGAVPGSPAR
jgi:hypothetical protein